MQFFKSFTLLLLSGMLILFLACDKDYPIVGEDGRSLHAPNVPLVSAFEEEAKIQVAKWVARTCNTNSAFKRALFEAIVDTETGASDELFFLDFVMRRYSEGYVKDAIVTANELEAEAFDAFLARVGQEAYTLVLDVPDYITWFFHPINQDKGIKDTYFEFPFVVFPDIRTKNVNGKWTGFGEADTANEHFDQNEQLVLHEIGEREPYRQIVPFFVKNAELNYVLPVHSRNLAREIFIDQYYGDVIAEGVDCIMEMMDQVAETVQLGASTYETINVMELREAARSCSKLLPPDDLPPVPTKCLSCDEICDNGIDDDEDGLIDEDECYYTVEIDCSNGTDDDRDGLIDADDPDCDCDCLRDCQEDHNILARHAFDDVEDYYWVTSEHIPGSEKLINIRYDITRLNAAACPPGTEDCPFLTNTKMVVSRATMLDCEDDGDYYDGIGINEFNTLCMEDATTWNATPSEGFFYGFLTDNTSASSHPQSISFAVLGDFVAVIIGTNEWVFENTHYMPASGDGNNEDWDASIYGNLIRVNMTEIDNDQLVSGNTQTDTEVITVGFESTQGVKVKVPLPFLGEGGGAERTEETKYSFSSERTKSVSRVFTVTAANVVPLGDIDLIYCDDAEVNYTGNTITRLNGYADDQDYNTIDDQNTYLHWWDVIIRQE